MQLEPSHPVRVQDYDWQPSDKDYVQCNDEKLDDPITLVHPGRGLERVMIQLKNQVVQCYNTEGLARYIGSLHPDPFANPILLLPQREGHIDSGQVSSILYRATKVAQKNYDIPAEIEKSASDEERAAWYAANIPYWPTYVLYNRYFWQMGVFEHMRLMRERYLRGEISYEANEEIQRNLATQQRLVYLSRANIKKIAESREIHPLRTAKRAKRGKNKKRAGAVAKKHAPKKNGRRAKRGG